MEQIIFRKPSFNVALKVLIVQSGLKQYEIAMAAGIEVTKLSATVNGHRELNQDEWERLALVLGVDEADIRPRADRDAELQARRGGIRAA